MRMRKSLKKTCNLRKRSTAKNNEGGSVVTYANPVEIEATIWSAGGKAQMEMYGERLPYIKNMQYEGPEEIKEFDGVCVNIPGTEKPDYEVRSANKDHSPQLFILEVIR